MKTKTVVIFLVLFLIPNTHTAQTTAVNSGVYVTAEDYENSKLIEEAECKNEKEKFERHDFFSRREFAVINKGKKITYLKKNIYAYRDCENKVWRFYNNKEYQIVETKDMYIYTIRKVVLNGITVEKDPVYYFSSSASGEIKELSDANLKSAYPNNKTFHNMLDAEFNSNKNEVNPDNGIHAYDFTHKMYKVNYIFSQSKN